MLACLGDLDVQAPPLHPWPQVAAELGNLEESRERMENVNMDKLQREFNKAAFDARQRIGDIIGRTMHVFNDPNIVNTIFLARSGMVAACILARGRGDFLEGLRQHLQLCSSSFRRIHWVPRRCL